MYNIILNKKIDMNNKLEISIEKVKLAAEKDPCAKKVLEILFPEVFEEDNIFCKIGIIFYRREYPKNVYTVFKWNGEVRILNITHNTMWDTKRNIKISTLKNPDILTIAEFKKLSGLDNIEGIIIK